MLLRLRCGEAKVGSGRLIGTQRDVRLDVEERVQAGGPTWRDGEEDGRRAGCVMLPPTTGAFVS